MFVTHWLVWIKDITYIQSYSPEYGACGVMVIVVGNRHDDTSSKPGPG